MHLETWCAVLHIHPRQCDRTLETRSKRSRSKHRHYRKELGLPAGTAEFFLWTPSEPALCYLDTTVGCIRARVECEVLRLPGEVRCGGQIDISGCNRTDCLIRLVETGHYRHGRLVALSLLVPPPQY